MKKKMVCVREYKRRCAEPSISKHATEENIRTLADEDECFENLVFELGVSVLRKELIKIDEATYLD